MDRVQPVRPTDLPKTANPAPAKTTREKVFEKVVGFIKEEFSYGGFKVNTDNITNETELLAIEGYDSLNVVNMMMELEEKFDITMPDEDIEEITTVGQAVDYVMKHARKENLP